MCASKANCLSEFCKTHQNLVSSLSDWKAVFLKFSKTTAYLSSSYKRSWWKPLRDALPAIASSGFSRIDSNAVKVASDAIPSVCTFISYKVSLMRNCQPPRKAWRAAQMTTFFMFILFFPSLVGVLSVIAVTVWRYGRVLTFSSMTLCCVIWWQAEEICNNC